MKVLEKTTGELETAHREALFKSTLASKVLSYLIFNTKISFIEADEPQYQTAFVNQKNELFLNANFYTNLPSDEQRAFVLMHEVMHIYFEHLPRFIEKDMDIRIANEAADHFNNLTLEGHISTGDDHKIDHKIQKYCEVPEWVLKDKRYIGWSMDEIYDDLVDNPERQAGGQDSGSGDGSQSGEGSSGRTVEDMSSWSVSESSNSESIKTKEVMSGALAYANATGIGDSPLDHMLTDKIDAMLTAPINYRGMINNLLAGAGEDIATYHRPSSRSDDDVLLPTFKGDRVWLLFGVDSSGSMSQDDYREAAGAILEAVSQFDDWVITIVSCDVNATFLGEYSSGEGDEFINMDLSFIGGGGTDMTPIAQYSKERVAMGDELSACIIVTDGHIPTEVDQHFEGTLDNMVLVTSAGNKSLKLSNAHVVHIQ